MSFPTERAKIRFALDDAYERRRERDALASERDKERRELACLASKLSHVQNACATLSKERKVIRAEIAEAAALGERASKTLAACANELEAEVRPGGRRAALQRQATAAAPPTRSHRQAPSQRPATGSGPSRRAGSAATMKLAQQQRR